MHVLICRAVWRRRNLTRSTSVDEVTQLIKHSGLFDIEDIRFFESNWDAHDDSDGDVVLDCSSCAKNIAKII